MPFAKAAVFVGDNTTKGKIFASNFMHLDLPCLVLLPYQSYIALCCFVFTGFGNGVFSLPNVGFYGLFMPW